MNARLRPPPFKVFGGPWRPRPTTKPPSGAILTIRIPVPPGKQNQVIRKTPTVDNAKSQYGSSASTPFP